MAPTVDQILAGLALADSAVTLAGRALDLLDPRQRAAFLRGRADRLRTRASHARRRRQRDRLLSRARGLDLRADALDPKDTP